MLTYIVFILRFGWTDATDVPVGYELGWAVFLLVQIVLSIALHSATLYITVMAAYIRYVAISTMTKNWCDRDVPWTRIAAIVVTVFTLCIPTCLLHSIVAVSDGSDTSTSMYTIVLEGYGELAVYTCELFKFNLWLTGIVFKRDGRITKMLVVVLLVFVCTELPQGLVSILNALFPNDIHFFVYTNFGELLDLLSLINSNACFIIYATVYTTLEDF
ncbi:Protein DMSR-6 [Aphelenchoides avenae]|nr:Protein DMSR-6 [Aphelenchus avenae]